MEQKIIGKNIAKFRKELGLSQTQLADFLYVTPQTVSKWETGNGTPEISLIPKIAIFLKVSIDELFGMSNLEQAEDVVLRYSIIREESLYHEAMKTLEHKLSTLSAECDKKEYYRLQGLKTHLYIQNSRDKISKGIQLSKEILSEIGEKYNHEWYLPFKLQLTLFRYMNGECREIYEEGKETFEQNPNLTTLHILCETLLMLKKYEEILEVLEENEKAVALLEKPDDETKGIFILRIASAAKLLQVDKAEKLAEMVAKECDSQERFDIQWALAEMYKDLGDVDKLACKREELLNLLEKLDIKDYMKEVYLQRMEETL